MSENIEYKVRWTAADGLVYELTKKSESDGRKSAETQSKSGRVANCAQVVEGETKLVWIYESGKLQETIDRTGMPNTVEAINIDDMRNPVKVKAEVGRNRTLANKVKATLEPKVEKSPALEQPKPAKKAKGAPKKTKGEPAEVATPLELVAEYTNEELINPPAPTAEAEVSGNNEDETMASKTAEKAKAKKALPKKATEVKTVGSPTKGAAKKTAEVKKAVGKVGSVLAEFGAREGTIRAQALALLAENINKPVAVEDLCQALYGDATKKSASALNMVLKGARDTITSRKLPYDVQRLAVGSIPHIKLARA